MQSFLKNVILLKKTKKKPESENIWTFYSKGRLPSYTGKWFLTYVSCKRTGTFCKRGLKVIHTYVGVSLYLIYAYEHEQM